MTSNTLALAIGPRITSRLPVDVARSGDDAAIELDCLPAVEPHHRAFLLLGEREVAALPRRERTTKLRFVVADAVPGDHVLRLRVNGIDTPLIADTAARPPAFDPSAIARIRP
jgi:hypothetical protein